LCRDGILKAWQPLIPSLLRAAEWASVGLPGLFLQSN
jgi:hypothetical protein